MLAGPGQGIGHQLGHQLPTTGRYSAVRAATTLAETFMGGLVLLLILLYSGVPIV
jgi:hypothetical protein